MLLIEVLEPVLARLRVLPLPHPLLALVPNETRLAEQRDTGERGESDACGREWEGGV